MGVAVVALSTGSAVYAAPVLTTTGSKTDTAFNATLGWSFTTPSTPLTVTVLDAVLNGTNTSDVVRLYNSSGTVLATATVTTSDPTETAGETYYSHAITSVVLPTSTTLYIAMNDPSSVSYSFYEGTSTPTMIDGLTYVRGLSSSGLNGSPTNSDAYIGDTNGGTVPAYFGPNFDVAVPEPASLAALGIPAAGLLLCRRRNQQSATTGRGFTAM